jgi:hypothetical protein
MKRSMWFLVALLVILPTLAQAQDLSHKLSDKTVVYAKIDLGTVMTQGEKYIEFIDGELSGSIVGNMDKLIATLKKLGAKNNFEPKLFDHLKETSVYMVLMAKEEPETVIETYRSPKWDPDTGQIIPGEFDESSYESVKEYTFSLVIESTDELAGDFLAQFLKLQDTLAEKKPEDNSLLWSEVEVPHGKMMKNEENDTFGHYGPYLVFSDCTPKELWANLAAPAENNLAGTALAKSFAAKSQPAIGTMLVNLGQLIKTLEDSLHEDLKEAEEALAAAADDEQEKEWAQYRVNSAREGLETYLRFKELFSLQQINFLGMNGLLDTTEEKISAEFEFALHFNGEISEALKLFLDSGHSLTVPSFINDDGMLFMGRIAYSDIMKLILENLPKDARDAMTQQDEGMSQQFGIGFMDALKLFAGDFYLSMDFGMKTISTWEWDPETGQANQVEKEEMLPDLLFFVGLTDAEKTEKVLSTVYEKMVEQMGPVVKKVTIEESTVYLFGEGVEEEGFEPDGLTSYAAVVIDRYWCVGSKARITDLLKRAKAGENGVSEELKAILTKHPNANFLMVIQKEYAERLAKLQQENVNEEMVDGIMDQIQNMTLDFEDEALEKEFRETLTALFKDFTSLGEKAQAIEQNTGVVHGKYEGDFYRIFTKNEARKK